MKDARAVVFRVRGTGLKCDRCKGANWRRKSVKFMVVPEWAVGRRTFMGINIKKVCKDHLRDAVLEVWK